MRYSIVVPVYNVKEYLGNCIDSIIGQIEDKHYQMEILLVDDGSTDGSEKICDDYKKRYPDLIKLIHKKNGGLLAARRTGFKAADGDYIINCDSDDMLMPDALDSIVHGIEETHADVLFYNAYQVMASGTYKAWFHDIFSNEGLTSITKEQVWENYFSGYATVSMCCKAVKRHCLAPQKEYSEYGKLNMGEDSLQSIEIYKNAETFAYLNKPLYGYRMSTGMTSSFDKNFYPQLKHVLQELLANQEHIICSDFNLGFSKKLYDIVGRAILQGRSTRNLGYKGEKKYLMKLRDDELVDEYKKYYQQIRNKIQSSHRIVCDLLIRNHITELYVLLKILNCIREG